MKHHSVTTTSCSYVKVGYYKAEWNSWGIKITRKAILEKVGVVLYTLIAFTKIHLQGREFIKNCWASGRKQAPQEKFYKWSSLDKTKLTLLLDPNTISLSGILLQQRAFHNQQYLQHTLHLELSQSLPGCSSPSFCLNWLVVWTVTASHLFVPVENFACGFYSRHLKTALNPSLWSLEF